MAEHNTKALLTAQDKEKAALKMETVANKMTDHLNKTVQKNMEKVQPKDVAIALCQLAQTRGSLKNMDPQHFVFVHVEGVPIEKRPKLKVSTLQHVLKTLGIPRKAFQFAKQNATLIASVADHFNLPRLSLTKVRKFSRHTMMPDRQDHWFSDFQRDNPDCPDAVRALLVASDQEKRTRESQAQAAKARLKKRTKPKKKKGK